MKRTKEKKERLREIRTGIRLRVKPPKAEKPATVYSRTSKHTRRIEPDTSSSLIMTRPLSRAA